MRGDNGDYKMRRRENHARGGASRRDGTDYMLSPATGATKKERNESNN